MMRVLLLLLTVQWMLAFVSCDASSSNDDACPSTMERPLPQVAYKDRLLNLGEDCEDDACSFEKTVSDTGEYYTLNKEKRVYYVSNFLNLTITNELKEICSHDRFVASPIRGSSTSGSLQVERHATLRTSESCVLVPAVLYRQNPRYLAMIERQPGDDSPLPPQVKQVQRQVDISWEIAQRASPFLHNHAPETVEPLQIVRYTNPDAQYQLHHDHGGYYEKSTEHRPWTLLLFLNDVSAGGRTQFPKLDLEVVPRGGDALIWSNVDSLGEVDPDMVHAGLPPAEAGVEKYAVNVWFGFEEGSEERIRSSGGQWGSGA